MNTLVNNFTALASPRNSNGSNNCCTSFSVDSDAALSVPVTQGDITTSTDQNRSFGCAFTRGSHQSDSSSSGSSSSSSSSDGNSTSSSSGGGSHSGGSGSISTTSTNANVSTPTGSSTDASSMSTRRFGQRRPPWRSVKVTVIKHECDRGRLSERHSSTACRRFHTQYAGSVRYGVLRITDSIFVGGAGQHEINMYCSSQE